MRIAPKDADAGRFKDLASRYETKPVPKLDATAIHGLRSGLVGGIVSAAYRGVSAEGSATGGLDSLRPDLLGF
jgi:hypothetical protein